MTTRAESGGVVKKERERGGTSEKNSLPLSLQKKTEPE